MAKRHAPAAAGCGRVPPPRLPARPMRDVATIRSPVAAHGHGADRRAAGVGQAAEDRPGRPGDERAGPDASRSCRRPSGGALPRTVPGRPRRTDGSSPGSACCWPRAGCRRRTRCPCRRRPPPRSRPGRPSAGWRRWPRPACRRRRRASGPGPDGPATVATMREATPLDANGSAPPRSTFRDSHVRPPSSETKKPWLSPPATRRPDGSSAMTVMNPAPWMGPELNLAAGGAAVGVYAATASVRSVAAPSTAMATAPAWPSMTVGARRGRGAARERDGRGGRAGRAGRPEGDGAGARVGRGHADHQLHRGHAGVRYGTGSRHLDGVERGARQRSGLANPRLGVTPEPSAARNGLVVSSTAAGG